MADFQETVLLVDDNPTNLEVLYQTLEDRGYRLLVARSGPAALKIAVDMHPTLILLDIMMPEMDGFEVCRRIKASARTADIAVIFLSALGDTESKVHGFQLGAVDFIAKPFQTEEIVVRVATHVRISALERELARRNRELESELTRILSTMHEGVYGLDGRGRITFANPAACAMTGFTEQESLGRDVFSLHLHTDDKGKHRKLDRSNYLQAFLRGERVESDCELVWRKDDTAFYADITLTPSMLDGRVGGAVVVFRDISERLKAQTELQAARMELQQQREHLAHMERLSTMGEMAAGFAHEVNQPLTAIANYAGVSRRLAVQEPLDRVKLGTTLEKMQNQALRASEVIQRLRSFVRKPRGGRKPRDPNTLVSEVIQLAEVDSRRNDVALHFTPAAGLGQVRVDEVQIQQVLLNLVRNAMETMRSSDRRSAGVEIRLGLDAGERVRFAVTDHGEGLAADAEERLFHPFYTTKEDGMGIGLSVCSSIVHDHGGTIGFDRNDDGGTTFWFTLDAHRSSVASMPR